MLPQAVLVFLLWVFYLLDGGQALATAGTVHFGISNTSCGRFRRAPYVQVSAFAASTVSPGSCVLRAASCITCAARAFYIAIAALVFCHAACA